jgi:hypothetical protein
MSLISGNVTFAENSFNISTTLDIIGTGIFLNNSSNLGSISNAQFQGNSQNLGTVVERAVFFDTSLNGGSVSNAVFTATSVNTGTIQNATFLGSAVNSGVVSQSAVFANTTVNAGVILGNASFSASADNSRGSVSGSVSEYVSNISHQYSYTGLSNSVVAWSDVQPLTTGTQLYLYQDSDLAIGNIVIDDSDHNFYFTKADGKITKIINVDHSYSFSSYWADISVLTVGAKLYQNRYDLTLVSSTTFVDGGKTYTVSNGYITNIANNEQAWYADASDAHHAVTLNGSVTQSDEGSGVVAALFDGSDSMDVTGALNYGTGDFTIEFFVKHTAFTNGDGSPADTSTGNNYYLDHGVNNFTASYLFGAVAYNDGSVAISRLDSIQPNQINFAADTWHHVAVVRNSGTVTIYNDGIANGSGSSTADLNYSGITLARYRGDNLHFIGKMAGFRIVIGTALYTSNFTVPTTLPTAVSGTQLLLNFGATAVPTVASGGGGNPTAGTVLSTQTNTININGTDYNNGTYDVIADGNGGSTNGNYQYAASGTEFYNDGTNSYQSDGNGGYTTVAIGGGSSDESNYQAWLAANSGVNQYSGSGSHNGQWAYNSTEYGSQAEAQAAADAVDESNYQAWLAANSGVNQYSGAGSRNGQWAYGSTEYASQADAQAAQGDAEYPAWLAANSGVNQYSGAGSHNGQWAYGSTEYASGLEAQNAEGDAYYPTWLAANSGVNQYTGSGIHNGQWVYNSNEYGSQAEAEAAYVAANGGGGGGNPPAGTVLSTETNYINFYAYAADYPNGTYDVIADGNGGSYNGNYQYASSGTEFFKNGSYSYQSDGNGSYTVVVSIPEWDNTASYNPGDQVTHNGYTWYVVGDYHPSSADEPGYSSYWATV